MIQIKHVGPVPNPPEAVFPLLAELVLRDEHSSASFLNPRRAALDLVVGARYRSRIAGIGHAACEIVVVQPNVEIATIAVTPLGTLRHSLVLRVERGEVWLEQTGEFEPRLLGKAVRRRARRKIQARFERCYRVLCAYLAAS